MRHYAIVAAVGMALSGGCAGPAATKDEPRVRVERQLQELYRPLLALVVESHDSVQDFMKTALKRDWIFPLETDQEVKLWLDKAERDLMPRNERMCALVRSKRDLVDGPDLTPNLKALLEHQDGWRAVHEKWKRDHVPYNWHSPTSFPKRLQAELEDTVQKLEARLRN
ncbi:MAG: hypothetical protein JO332_01570 [Planctomycetaceae bacterium]|nr:hypothetical protein [Planctomycetaceae bacterium]